MRYVYGEELLVTCFLMDLLLLRTALAMTDRRKRWGRSILAALLGTALAFPALFFFGFFGRLLITLCTAPLMALCTVGKKCGRVTLYLLFSAFLCGGASVASAEVFGSPVPAALGIPIMLLLCARWKYVTESRRIEKRCADVRIAVLGRTFSCIGFYDSGHFLRDPAGDLLIVAEQRVFGEVSPTESGTVSFRSIGGEGHLPMIRPDAVWIDGKRIFTSVALFDGELDAYRRYRALLPIGIEEE